jgi:hypothetical protein
MRGSRTIRTAKNRAAVLAALAQGWSVHAATQRAGIGYQSYYDWRDDDSTFRAEADAAIEAATDLLEDEARRRAMDASDLLLIFLLRSRRPHIYNRKQTMAIGGDVDSPPLAIHHSGGPKNVHFYIPTNGRDQPEVLDESLTIEGTPVSDGEDEAAAQRNHRQRRGTSDVA